MRIESGGGVTSVGNATVHFINNTANGVGGAVYISNSNWIWYQSLCSASGLHPVFDSNFAALAGNNIYGGIYINCLVNNNMYYVRNFLYGINCNE